MRISPAALAALLVLAASVPSLAKKHGTGGADADDDDAAASTSATSTQGSPSSSSPSPTASPSFQFMPPANASTCQSTTLSWTSSDFDAPMTITVTNDRAADPSTGIPSSAVLVSHTLTTNVSASAHVYTWAPVDVPQGSYVAVAFDTSRALDVLAQSPTFFVLSGEDSSCIASATSSSSSGASSGTGSTTSAAAEPDSSQPGKLSPAVLGGVVAGVVVGVVLLIVAATFPHYWKERFRMRRNRRPGGPYYLF